MTSAVLLQGLGNGVIWDALGIPLNGHQVYVYQRGTTTQVQVWQNSARTVPLSQPLTTGASLASPGGIPGYVNGEQSLDFYDATTNTRVFAEPVAGADVVAITAVTYLPLPTGIAGTDTANLAATLALGGRIRPNPAALTAAYSLTAPLVAAVGGSTDVDFGGCTFTLTGKFNMLQNAAVAPVATATDAAITATTSVVASPTLAAVAQVGQQLAVVGAGVDAPVQPSGTATSWLYGTVLSVVGNNITLTGNQNGVAATHTVSSATAYLFNRDQNVKISGGTWDSAHIWDAVADRIAAGFNSHLIRLRRIDGLVVRDMTVKSQTFSGGTKGMSFGINPADCTDFLIENNKGVNSSATVQCDGLMARGVIRSTYGSTQDDQLALGCVGFGGGDVEGDITDVEIDGVFANNSYRALTLFAGQGANGAARIMRGVTARTIKGSTQLEAIRIVDYAGHSWVDATIEDADVIVGSSSYPLINVTANAAQTITLRDITWPFYGPVASSGVINCGDHVPVLRVENLKIRGSSGSYVGVVLNVVNSKYWDVTIDGVYQPDSAISCDIVQHIGGVVDLLSVKNVRQTGAGHVVYVNGGTPTVVNVSDGYQDNAASIVHEDVSSTTAALLKVASFSTGGTNAIITRRPLTVFLNNADVNESGPVISAVGANATPVRVLSAALRQFGVGNLLARDGTQTLSVNMSGSLGTAFGLDASILTPLDQDVVVNNGTGLAGAIIYNSASGLWRQLSSQAGVELAYAAITANQTGISTEADVTSLTVTFTAPASGNVTITAWCPSMQQVTSSSFPLWKITDSSNNIKAYCGSGTLAAGAFGPGLTAIARISGLTPGTSYTYKVRASTAAGTTTVTAAATQPAFIRAVGG